MPSAILQLMRPGDWTKNVFVLIAPVFAVPSLIGTLPGAVEQPIETAALLRLGAAAVAAFVAFCTVSSGFYCINDVFDMAADRMHPIKRRRPVASGAVPASKALALGIVLVVAGTVLGFLVNAPLGIILTVYAVLQVLYNVRLKRVLLVDVVTVATGFGLRAAAGAVAIEVQISIWLLLCVFFLCLYLGFVKRLCDLTSAETQGGEAWTPSAEYDDRAELHWLLGISAVLAVMTYLMYTLSAHAHEIFGARAIGFSLLSPLVIITVHRFYRRARTGLSDSPLSALRQDRAVVASIVLFAIGTVVTLYVPAVAEILDRVFFAVWADGGVS